MKAYLSQTHFFGTTVPKRIAVVRALPGLGDLLCLVPALRSLRTAFPGSKISLIGLPWAKTFVQRFHHYCDEWLEFPGFPGIPEVPLDPQKVVAGIAELQQHDFDLALQLHGSGSVINPFVLLLGAKQTACFSPHNTGVAFGPDVSPSATTHSPNAAPLPTHPPTYRRSDGTSLPQSPTHLPTYRRSDGTSLPQSPTHSPTYRRSDGTSVPQSPTHSPTYRRSDGTSVPQSPTHPPTYRRSDGTSLPQPFHFFPYPDGEHEIHRNLRLLEHLGIPLQGTDLEFPLTQTDWDEFDTLAHQHSLPQNYICIHPGASVPDRRYPPELFAAIAATLASEGFPIVLTGTPPEAPLTQAVRAAMHHPAIDLTGQTTLGSMAVLLKRSRLLISNDTGVSHLAAALQTPSVILFSNSDPHRWAPLNGDRHRIILPHPPLEPADPSTPFLSLSKDPLPHPVPELVEGSTPPLTLTQTLTAALHLLSPTLTHAV